MRCQGTKSSVPSDQNISESPATLLHVAVSGLLAFYLCVTFWGKVVFENCSNVPHSYSPPLDSALGAKPRSSLPLDPQISVLYPLPDPMTEQFLSNSRDIRLPS